MGAPPPATYRPLLGPPACKCCLPTAGTCAQCCLLDQGHAAGSPLRARLPVPPLAPPLSLHARTRACASALVGPSASTHHPAPACLHVCDHRCLPVMLSCSAVPCLQGDPIELKVNKLMSVKNLPYEYYSLPYCRPDKIRSFAENLGEVLRGDRIENSPYQVGGAGLCILGRGHRQARHCLPRWCVHSCVCVCGRESIRRAALQAAMLATRIMQGWGCRNLGDAQGCRGMGDANRC